MNIKTDRNRTLAFAGILQALQLVQQTAYGRPYDTASLQATLNSILSIDSDQVDGIFSGIDGIRSGLRLVSRQLLGTAQKPDPELSRYLIVLLHLERKLGKRRALLQKLRSGIEQSQHQVRHFDLLHPNVLAGLANTYSETVSTLSPRIMVNGDPMRLHESGSANQIRALLLAAMRSAVLWRQCGGSRMGLLLGRRNMTGVARSLLQE
jgi:high frequency lysogenization protein